MTPLPRPHRPVELAQKIGKDGTVQLLEDAGTTPVAHAVANPARRKSTKSLLPVAALAPTATAS